MNDISIICYLFIMYLNTHLHSQAEYVKSVFSEINSMSDTFEVLISPDEPYLRLSVSGLAGHFYVCLSVCFRSIFTLSLVR